MTPARLVLDTNVWLDWLVFDDPALAPLRTAYAQKRVSIFIDAPCTEELRRVLAYRLSKSVLGAAEQEAAMILCLRVATPVTAPMGTGLPPLPDCRDPDDQKFLELARAAGAHALLTKDRALLELARRKYRPTGFAILTPQTWAAGQGPLAETKPPA